MIRFILGKLLYLVPTFLGITFVAFSFVRVLPKLTRSRFE